MADSAVFGKNIFKKEQFILFFFKVDLPDWPFSPFTPGTIQELTGKFFYKIKHDLFYFILL